MSENTIFGIFKHPQEDPLLLHSKYVVPFAFEEKSISEVNSI